MKIAVYGANGYQGKLVLAELARRGMEMVLIGRSRERLSAAASQVGVADAEIRIADADCSHALASVDALINCAGPYTVSGQAVARAAITAGCQYVDLSGEQLYVKEFFDDLGPDAERAGVALVPMMTESGAIDDLLAALLAARLQPAEIALAHKNLNTGGLSRGSARSALKTIDFLRTGGLAYEDGKWRTDAPALRKSVTFLGGEDVPVVKFAMPAVVTIPRHVDVQRVQGLLDAETGERVTAAALSEELIEAMPEGPSEEDRRAQRFTIVVDATADDGSSVQATATGNDAYRTPAVMAVEAARRLIADPPKPGVLAPAQAFSPADFLDFLGRNGLTWAIAGWEAR
ncbi:saccharopine dehydrogenase family protein [Actinomadura sp. 1N219]|uniref:saccharopine dehydrogenase family protein n=1 Tax=Actinomadura sp. 1N219 TaxID=3375152 RepID=UPI00379DC139